MNTIEKIQVVKRTVETYYNNVKESYENFNEDEKEHIIKIGTDILCTKWDIEYSSGGFVQAFIENNLTETIARADITCIKALHFFIRLSYNVGMPQFI